MLESEESRLPHEPAIELRRQLARRVGTSRSLPGFHGADAAFVFSNLAESSPAVYVWVCWDNRAAERVARDLHFFTSQPISLVPGFEADPYRGLSPHPEISEKRSQALWDLLELKRGFVVTTIHALAGRLPSPENFRSNCLRLETGCFYPLDHLLSQLRDSGYLREEPVSEVGEFSSRGGIVDVFSPAHEHPLRLEFFGDELESIRLFDPSTQRSVSMINRGNIVPMRELVLTRREIERWHQRAPEYFSQVRFAEALQEKLQFTQNGELFNGFESLMPLVVDNLSGLLDYLPRAEGPAQVILDRPQDLFAELDRFRETVEASYREREAAGELVLPPARLFFARDELERRLREVPLYRLPELPEEVEGEAQPTPLNFREERKYQNRLVELINDLQGWRQAGERVVLVMTSHGMAERLADIFQEYDLTVPVLGSFEAALERPVAIAEGRISRGFHCPELQLHVLSQENLFAEAGVRPSRKKYVPQQLTGPFLSDFRDLREGDYVVHVEHGIGRFQGLERIGVEAGEKEFVELVYRDEAKLYVPIDRLDLLQKFSGAGQTQPQLDRLGGASWERTKTRIKRSVRQLAEDLLKLYARRELSQGHAFSADDELMREFEEAFEFEETPDQQQAIADVRRDMEASRPMDRLICGDVGYGKTEVAMRAAFKAVNDGRQVALLAPTTVLAFQHFNTFRERFQGFPVHIEMISRFRSRAEQKEILERVRMGLVDILIGTHRLLSKDVRLPKLGLIVVDEEQRFGVSQKEKLKKLKMQVDVLTLSATPIPRTLNMSMIGLRDLSIIETPPKDRLAIQTVLVKYSPSIIRSAIDLELKRQGQVFFLHNDVRTIHSMANTIQQISPEARVAVAHGQMKESLLEEVMLDFLDYRYDTLVSTTIIENGLDIPRANTLIVNRADRFGLSQLYQLRGRVGRASRRAYAYLLIPSQDTLTSDARRRLRAIREFSDLGAGFRIAALDLEIRGAGNLLGAEQHGHINAVGLELYLKLLEETVHELKGEPVPDDLQTSIDLRLDIQIPEHYLQDSALRLWLYKRISTVTAHEKLESLRDETIDRFGRFPRPVSNLFQYAHLRLKARHLRILALERSGARIRIRFRDDTPIAPSKLVPWVERRDSISLNPDGVLTLQVGSFVEGRLFEHLEETLEELSMLK